MPDITHTLSSVATDWLAASQQRAFRQLMSCFSYPGRIGLLDTEAEHGLPLLLATLLDRGVGLSDPHHLLADDEYRRLAIRPSRPEKAAFVVVPGTCPPDFLPLLGSLENPEHGATVIVVADSVSSGVGLQLSGPGIDGETVITIDGIDAAWWQQRAQWNASFPLGVDMMVVAGRKVLALPRTTRIAMKGVN